LRLDQLKALENNPEGTLLERVICKVLIKAFTKGTLWDLNSILDRVVGLPKQTQEITQEIDFTKFKVEVIHTGVPFATRESEVDVSRPAPPGDPDKTKEAVPGK
jgi:hypothetical protein